MGIPIDHPAIRQAVERGLIRKVSRAPIPVALTRDGGSWTLSAVLPVLVVSEANRRGHWAKKARRAAAQRLAVRAALASTAFPPAARYWVTLTRLYARGRGMDDDNLAGAFKAVRDELAARVRLDDGDPRFVWSYGQEKAAAAGIRIHVAGSATPNDPDTAP